MNRINTGILYSALCVLLLVATGATAQKGIYVEEQGYRVFHNVFNSTMIPPEVANIYQLTRDKDQVYINIVVTKITGQGQTLGLPAKLTGYAKNLMQQQQRLEFVTIDEPGTVYYLAPVDHDNEEVFHFVVQVIPEGADRPIDIKFSKKLYVE